MTMASGIYGVTLQDQFDSSQIGVDVTGAGHEFQLVTDTHTPDFNLDASETAIDNEITGTLGDYTAGGEAFTSPALAASGGILTCSASNDVLTGMTVTGIRGRVAFDDTPTTPTADPLTFATTFGADYDVTSGTLTINNSSGLFTIDYIP